MCVWDSRCGFNFGIVWYNFINGEYIEIRPSFISTPKILNVS